MARFIGKRVLGAIGILLVLTAIVFALQRFSKADPIKAKLGAFATTEQVEAEREKLGYNDPLPTQYTRYVSGVVQGDFGESLRSRREVSDDLRSFVPASIELITFTILLAAVWGTLLAMVTTRVGRRADSVRVLMTVGASIPGFLLTLWGVMLLYRRLGILPASGRTAYLDAPTGPTGFLTVDGLIAGRPEVTIDAVHHLILPAVCAALVPAVAIARVLRGSLVTTMRSDYVRTARAKGLKEGTVLRRHALRNAAGPTMSLMGLLVASLFAGTLIVEQIVAWPGLGAYLLRSIASADFPAISGIVIVLGVIYVSVNLIVEIAQSFIDPRLRAAG